MKPYHLYNVRQYALIFNEDNAFLALQIPLRYSESGGKWALPGGRMESHDQPRGGLLREVKEETGLDISIDCICHTGVWSSGSISKYAVFYVAAAKDLTAFSLSHEHESSAWITEDTLDDYTFFEPPFMQAAKQAYKMRKRLKKA